MKSLTSKLLEGLDKQKSLLPDQEKNLDKCMEKLAELVDKYHKAAQDNK